MCPFCLSSSLPSPRPLFLRHYLYPSLTTSIPSSFSIAPLTHPPHFYSPVPFSLPLPLPSPLPSLLSSSHSPLFSCSLSYHYRNSLGERGLAFKYTTKAADQAISRGAFAVGLSLCNYALITALSQADLGEDEELRIVIDDVCRLNILPFFTL